MTFKLKIELTLEDRDDITITERVSATLRAMAEASDRDMNLSPLTVYEHRDSRIIASVEHSNRPPHEARLIGAVDLSHSRADHRHAYR